MLQRFLGEQGDLEPSPREEDYDNLPDQPEWDEDNDGDPDNYFLVTNALTLGTQLSKAFEDIIQRVGSASSASVNAGSISSETRISRRSSTAATGADSYCHSRLSPSMTPPQRL